VDYLVDLGGTPQWAARDPSSCGGFPQAAICTSPPANLDDWIDYVTAVVSRYKGRIQYYELWNEPNTRHFWTGSYADMVELARSAYTIIKTIDPDALVLTPAPTGPVHPVRPGSGFIASAPDWMATYLRAGGAEFADIGAWHGYIGRTGTTPYPMPEQDATPGCAPEDCYGSINRKIELMRATFDANGMGSKPMFDTEGGWGVTTNLNPADQPGWLARWYLLQASSYATDNLQRVYWFAWGGPVGGQPWGTLEDSSGAPNAAGIAANQVYDWLVGAAFTQPCAGVADGLWTCGLTLANGRQAVVVWSAGGASSYSPSSGAAQYRDLAGNTTPVRGPITVGARPVLVES